MGVPFIASKKSIYDTGLATKEGTTSGIAGNTAAALKSATPVITVAPKTTTTTTAPKTTTTTTAPKTVVPKVVSTTPSPPAVDPLVQAALDKAKGESLIIEYRTPSGEIKSYITSNLGASNVPGEFLSAKVHLPSGGIGNVYTYTKDNQQIIFDVREQVLATPSQKEQYEKTGIISSEIRSQINVPSEFMSPFQPGIAPLYQKTVYEKYLGIDTTGSENILNEYLSNVEYIKTHPSEVKKQPSIRDQIVSGGQKVWAYVFTDLPSSIQRAYDVYSNTGDPNAITERSLATWKTRWEKQDIIGSGIGIIESPFGTLGTFYGLGAGLGAVAGTKIGQIVIGTIPRTTIISSRNLITLERALVIPEIKITPSLALNVATGTYFASEMAKSGYESFTSGNIKNWLGTTALSLPIVMIPFKAGYKAGGGYVQRTGAMGTVTDPMQRIQQQAVYDMIKTTERLHEPYLEQRPYDITQVKDVTPSQIGSMETYLKSLKAKVIQKPAIGGSTAMDIQMGDFYRKGGYPQRILDIAIERQSQTIRPEMRGMQPQVGGVPGDIDILLGGRFATEKMAEAWSKKLDTHVHISKPNEPYWGGYSTKPFTNSLVSFIDEPISVKTLSVREQFLRYGHSVLPSNIMEKSYRAYKDVPGFYDTFDVLQFQKGGTKLNEAMNRFLYPEGYKSPRVTMGERVIKRIGRATGYPSELELKNLNQLIRKNPYINWIDTLPYTHIPSLIVSNPIYENEGYIKSNYPLDSYVNKGFDYQPINKYNLIKTDYDTYIYTEPGYNPLIRTDYNGYTPIKPTYIPPYFPPTYIPPSYEPPYNPPTYKPKYKPPYNPPKYAPPYYPPSYYPDYTPPIKPTKKKRPEDDIMENMERIYKGFNVLIKEQYIFGGVKTKYPEYKRINVQPLTKESAYSLLATHLKQTARASGMIEVTEGKPAKVKSAYGWMDVASEFYEKQGVIIQKASKRIGTPGELKEITYKGLAARRRR